MEKVFPRSTASWNELARIFAYDRTLSPDVREAGIGNVDGIIIHDISYAGFSQERIQAFLVEPMGEAPGQELCLFIPGREKPADISGRGRTHGTKGCILPSDRCPAV